MSWLGRLLVLLAAVVVFLFATVAVNQTQVSLSFLAWDTPEISVFWWLLISFLLGLGLGMLWLAVVSTRARMREKRLARDLASSQQELVKLRNLPIQDA